MKELDVLPIENAVSLCFRLFVLRKISFNSKESDFGWDLALCSPPSRANGGLDYFLSLTKINWVISIERFSIVSKVIRVLLWFCFTSLCDWLKPFAPLSRPIRSKLKPISRDLLALSRVFPRLTPVTCTCFEFWLVHWVISVCCDWLG